LEPRRHTSARRAHHRDGGKAPAAGCLLVAVTLELLRAGHKSIAAALVQWATRLHVDPDERYFGRAVAWIAGLDDHRLQVVEAGLLAYGALFLAEGIGLVLRQRWGGAEARSS
jgi:uncharacterized membrane protein (DUF2068 family)